MRGMRSKGDHVTDDRFLKQAVRRRMEQTGEKYTEARRAVLATSVGALKAGELRTVIVAWRLDDPAVQNDGRFWSKVPDEGAELFKRPPGTIVPKGQSLASWRARADGDVVEVPSPINRRKERISLARWGEADPDRTYVIPQFHHLPEELAGRQREEVERIREEQLARSETRRVIKPKLSEEVKERQAELAEVQRQVREARDRGDEQRMAELRPALDAKLEELQQADFPNFARGWDFSRAIREGPGRFILDWTTGY